MEKNVPVLQNPFRFDPELHRKEKGGGKSETVPDQSMTPRELYERFTIGGMLPPGREPVFAEGDLDSDDLEKLRDADVFVREQKARSVADDIKRYQQQVDEERSEFRRKRQEAADKAADEAEVRRSSRREPKGDAGKEEGAK